MKNFLDLKHSLNLTKGSTFLALGIGGAIAIFFGLSEIITNKNLRYIPFLIALIWFTIFGWFTIINFSECNKIQKRIRGLKRIRGFIR